MKNPPERYARYTSIECPHCKMPPGDHCVSPKGTMIDAHKKRQHKTILEGIKETESGNDEEGLPASSKSTS